MAADKLTLLEDELFAALDALKLRYKALLPLNLAPEINRAIESGDRLRRKRIKGQERNKTVVPARAGPKQKRKQDPVQRQIKAKVLDPKCFKHGLGANVFLISSRTGLQIDHLCKSRDGNGVGHVFHLPLINQPLVYLLLRSGMVVYVGMSCQFAVRLADHIYSKRFEQVFYIPTETANAASTLEKLLIRHYRPEYNALHLARRKPPNFDGPQNGLSAVAA